MKRILRLSLPVLSLLLIASFLFSCGKTANESYSPAPGSYRSDFDFYNSASKLESYHESPYEDTGTVPDDAEQKKILRGQVTAETKSFEDALNRLELEISGSGGYIGSSETTGNSLGTTGRRHAYLVARIPAANFRTFLSQLSSFLNIISESTSSEDVTESYYETESRVNSLKIQEERLLAMLEKAETLDDMIKLEERLSEVRRQIGYYDSLLRSLDGKIEYATITVTVYEVLSLTDPVVEDPSFGSQIGKAFRNSWEIFLSFLRGTVIVLIYLLPILLVAAVVIAVILLLTRKRRLERRNRRKAETAFYQQQQAAEQVGRQPPVNS